MTRSWLIGKGADCDVVVDRPGISDRHCRLTREADGAVLEDLGSAASTMVNGTRIGAKARVTPGDAVTLGPNNIPMPWPEEALPAGWKVLRIGREADNDFLINLATVSGYHARLLWNVATNEAILEDLGSSNGTALGDPTRKVTRSRLTAADTVFLGSHAVPGAVLLNNVASTRVTPLLTFRGREMIVGRDPSCGLVIDLPVVSGRHARLSRSEDGVVIEDLASSNGTFVHGQRIDRPVLVKPGDRICLGSYTLEFVDADEGVATAPSTTIAPSPPPSLSPASPDPLPSAGISPRSQAPWAIPAAVVLCLCVAVLAWMLRGKGGDSPKPSTSLPPPPSTPERQLEVLADLGRKAAQDVLVPRAAPSVPVPPTVATVPPTVTTVAPTPAPEGPSLVAGPVSPVKLPPPDQPAPVPVKPPSDQPAATVVAWVEALDLSHLTPEEETRLGNAIHRILMNHIQASEDDALSVRAEHAVRQVTPKSYTITVMDSDAVNAFSHPGGFLYVSRGLIDMFGTDEDYALEFALGHEVAHLELKHALTNVKAAAVEAKKQGKDTLNLFLIPIAMGYPDAQEFEADSWIFKRMSQTDHTKRELLTFLRKFKDYARKNKFANGREWPTTEYPLAENHYRAHPAAAARLARLEQIFATPARVAPKP